MAAAAKPRVAAMNEDQLFEARIEMCVRMSIHETRLVRCTRPRYVTLTLRVITVMLRLPLRYGAVGGITVTTATLLEISCAAVAT